MMGGFLIIYLKNLFKFNELVVTFKMTGEHSMQMSCGLHFLQFFK